MRSLAKVMLFGGCFLCMLAAYSETGHLSKANQVGDVLAMGMSLLVAAIGLVFLLLTRADGPMKRLLDRFEAAQSRRGGETAARRP